MPAEMTDYNFSPDEIEMLNKYRDEQNDSRLKPRFIALLLRFSILCAK